MRTLGMLVALALAGPVVAQESPSAPKASRPEALRLQVNVTRYQGEKKLGSLPYVLSIAADDRPLHMRQGVKVPLPPNKDGGVSYTDVGMNIDCSVAPLEDGRYKVGCTVQQSSVFPLEGDGKAGRPLPPFVDRLGAPILGSFLTEGRVILKDGQTAPFASVTDPVTGETLKVDLSLSVVHS
jgi:hypothetical protein